MELQFILPIAVFIVLFFIIQFITKKNLLNNNIFIRLRILLGCLFLGFLITEIVNATTVMSVILRIGLAGILFYGVYLLQKKYFVIKGTE